jgi:hypothetical protein
MSYLVLKPKTKKEESILKQIAELLKVDYKEISIETYIRDIAESRRQIKSGKKISLKDLENGI